MTNPNKIRWTSQNHSNVHDKFVCLLIQLLRVKLKQFHTYPRVCAGLDIAKSGSHVVPGGSYMLYHDQLQAWLSFRLYATMMLVLMKMKQRCVMEVGHSDQCSEAACLNSTIEQEHLQQLPRLNSRNLQWSGWPAGSWHASNAAAGAATFWRRWCAMTRGLLGCCEVWRTAFEPGPVCVFLGGVVFPKNNFMFLVSRFIFLRGMFLNSSGMWKFLIDFDGNRTLQTEPLCGTPCRSHVPWPKS